MVCSILKFGTWYFVTNRPKIDSKTPFQPAHCTLSTLLGDATELKMWLFEDAIFNARYLYFENTRVGSVTRVLAITSLVQIVCSLLKFGTGLISAKDYGL